MDITDRLCKVCFDDIIPDCVLTYQMEENGDLKDFDYCESCMIMLRDTMWEKYIQSLKTADCEKSLANLIIVGPPVNFRDNSIEDNREIYKFYSKGGELSAKLPDSLELSQRNKLHERLLEIVGTIRNKDAPPESLDPEVSLFSLENRAHDVKDENVTKFDYLENINLVLKEFNL